MKRLLILILIAALVPTIALGAGLKIGPKIGINLANATLDPEAEGLDKKMRLGIMGGAFGEIALTEKNDMAIRLELLYVQKGWKFDGSESIEGFSVDYSATIKADEFVVAPFFVYYFKTEKVKPFLQIGPEFGFNMTKEITAEATAMGMTVEETTEIEDWASMDLSINIGGGVAIPVGKGEIMADLRYSLGLTDMDTYEPQAGEEDSSVKLNGIQILVGYAFALPTK
ncbi:PorT family protein [bacterium]|nr:PorT family protein [bacterium]MBU1984269.1 PorT family protein [bacterium]